MKNPKIIAELSFIAQANGGILSPAAVVEYAQDESSALHSCFTWDDTAAAHQWRLSQARQLIRVCVTMIKVDGQDTPMRVYCSLKDDRYNSRGYRPMVEVLQDQGLKRQLLAEAQQEMEVFVRKYKTLVELSEVFAAMQKVLGKTERKYRRQQSSHPAII